MARTGCIEWHQSISQRQVISLKNRLYGDERHVPL